MKGPLACPENDCEGRLTQLYHRGGKAVGRLLQCSTCGNAYKVTLTKV